MGPEALAPAEVTAFVLADLALILIMARLVGGLFVRIGQPRVVGEIVAGIILGPTVLGGELSRGAVTSLGRPAEEGEGLVAEVFPLQSFAVLAIIGTLTLVLYMFMIGLDVRGEALRGRVAQIVAVSAAVILVPVGLGFVLAGILDTPGTWRADVTPKGLEVSELTHALFLGAALAVTAFPIMARVMQEKRMLTTPVGAIGVGAAALVTPLMFIVLAGATASAEGEGVPQTLGVKLALAAALALVLLGPVRLALGVYLGPRHDPEDPLSAETFALLLIGALVSGLAADRIGIHALTGAFLFGTAVPRLPGLTRAVIESLQRFVVVFLMPVFIALAGLQTDLRALRWGLIPGILVFLAALLISKWGAGAVAGRAVGLRWREANLIGVLLNCRGLMILVIALIGREAGVITEPLLAAFMAGAIVTTVMTGPLVDRFTPREAEAERRDESISQSLTGVPAMTGGPRVLVSVEPGFEARLLEAARDYVEGEPPPQFLVVTLPPLAEGGDYIGAGPEEAAAAVRQATTRLLTLADGLRAAGTDTSVASFQSPSPVEDLAHLATEWAATDAITTSQPEERALSAISIDVRLVS